MEGALPLDLCLEQLPKRLVVGPTTYRFEYEPVFAESGEVDRVVLIVSDVTARVLQEHAAARQQDLIAAFEWILRDPDAFRGFLERARRDVAGIADGSLRSGALMRCLHTLKGNSAVVGLSALSQKCHELETELSTEGRLAPVSLEELRHELSVVEQGLSHFVTERRRVRALSRSSGVVSERPPRGIAGKTACRRAMPFRRYPVAALGWAACARSVKHSASPSR
jgi:HPt (histidine-containing phosphotransfer) domain-containing protein